jgi:hypothetical protein
MKLNQGWFCWSATCPIDISPRKKRPMCNDDCPLPSCIGVKKSSRKCLPSFISFIVVWLHGDIFRYGDKFTLYLSFGYLKLLMKQVDDYVRWFGNVLGRSVCLLQGINVSDFYQNNYGGHKSLRIIGKYMSGALPTQTFIFRKITTPPSGQFPERGALNFDIQSVRKRWTHQG